MTTDNRALIEEARIVAETPYAFDPLVIGALFTRLADALETAEPKAAPKDNEALRLRILRAAQDCPLGRNLTEFESVSFANAVMPIVDAETQALREKVERRDKANQEITNENARLRSVIDQAAKLADEWHDDEQARVKPNQNFERRLIHSMEIRLRCVLAVPETTQEQQEEARQ